MHQVGAVVPQGGGNLAVGALGVERPSGQESRVRLGNTEAIAKNGDAIHTVLSGQRLRLQHRDDDRLASAKLVLERDASRQLLDAALVRVEGAREKRGAYGCHGASPRLLIGRAGMP